MAVASTEELVEWPIRSGDLGLSLRGLDFTTDGFWLRGDLACQSAQRRACRGAPGRHFARCRPASISVQRSPNHFFDSQFFAAYRLGDRLDEWTSGPGGVSTGNYHRVVSNLRRHVADRQTAAALRDPKCATRVFLSSISPPAGGSCLRVLWSVASDAILRVALRLE